jgi:murein DD-endopeptidase MepM/ murein hydrolase activator NlpD
MSSQRSAVLATALSLALAACDFGTDPPLEGVRFHPPLAGTPMMDLFYGGYLDHAPEGSVRDYECGPQTYDGHTGVDILLRNFAVQDSGIAVLAAAKGTVEHVSDGQPDRNTSWDGTAGLGNRVVLQHGNGLQTYYGHLRRGSVAVRAGETVEAGTVLGLVGSSGRSNWPHLHFEVRQGGRAVDPFSGDCSSGTTLWTDQLPYQNEFKVLDGGLTSDLPLTRAALLERPPSVRAVPEDQGEMGFWIQMVNQAPAFVRIQVRGPAGDPVHEVSGNVGYAWIRYLTTVVPVAGLLTAGEWEVRAYQNGVPIWAEPFRVEAAEGSVARTAAIRLHGIQVIDQAPDGGYR